MTYTSADEHATCSFLRVFARALGSATPAFQHERA